jgi:hypothetical protein
MSSDRSGMFDAAVTPPCVPSGCDQRDTHPAQIRRLGADRSGFLTSRARATVDTHRIKATGVTGRVHEGDDDRSRPFAATGYDHATMEDRPGTLAVPTWIVGVVAVVLFIWIFGPFGLIGAPLLLIATGLQGHSRFLVAAGVALGVVLMIGALLVLPAGVGGGVIDGGVSESAP